MKYMLFKHGYISEDKNIYIVLKRNYVEELFNEY